jgi:hypothetical protein
MTDDRRTPAERDNDRRVLALRIAFATCGAFGISRADRLEWAGLVLDRTVETFRDLSLPEAERLVDAAQGAVWMARIKGDYRTGERIAPKVRPRWPQAR